MKQQTPERTKRLAVVAAAAVILVMVLLIIETFRLLLPGLWTAKPWWGRLQRYRNPRCRLCRAYLSCNHA